MIFALKLFSILEASFLYFVSYGSHQFVKSTCMRVLSLSLSLGPEFLKAFRLVIIHAMNISSLQVDYFSVISKLYAAKVIFDKMIT